VNIYDILADGILILHLAYMGYIVFGQLLIMIGWPLRWGWIRNPWFRFSHLALIAIVAFEAIFGWRCPLTTWEEQLRVAAGQELVIRTREDGNNYVDDIEGMSFTARVLRKIQFAGAMCPNNLNYIYYTVTGLIVATVILVPPRLRHKPPQAPAPPPETVAPPDPVPSQGSSG
jgi:hypothetical protein